MSNQKSRKTSKNGSDGEICCWQCDQDIPNRAHAYFVEEEVGRLFCSESCITDAFQPDIQKLEKIYQNFSSQPDLSDAEREKFSDLRWRSLEQPNEVWMEKTVHGDHRYTLIKVENIEGKPVAAVAVCLMLRGEPSFLFIAFVTANAQLVDDFRRGDRMQIIQRDAEGNAERGAAGGHTVPSQDANAPMANLALYQGPDRLAEGGWNEDDSIRVLLTQTRKKTDIPDDEFKQYEHCLEETLQSPNELWSYQIAAKRKAYHFIKKYDFDAGSYWYVIIAKDADDVSQIELSDAFPTNDPDLVERARHGYAEPIPGTDFEEKATGTYGIPIHKPVKKVH
jgi:hypothetical protein